MKRWSNAEIKIIKENCHRQIDKKIYSLLNRSPVSIYRKAYNMGLVNSSHKWTKDDLIYLSQNYKISNKEHLIKKFNTSWAAITSAASTHGYKIQKPVYLQKLLEDTPEAYYWIGFIMADGYLMYYNDKPHSIGIEIIDKEHLQKFINFLNIDKVPLKKNNNYYVNICDKQNVQKITNKFNIKRKKTYNPPEPLINVDKKLLLSLITGFIDGDGSIYWKNIKRLQIENNINWKKYLEYIGDFLYNYFNIDGPIILYDRHYNNVNTCVLAISKNKLIKNIKTEALKLNLPLLNRKWDKVSI